MINVVKRIAILADFPWSYFEHGSTGRGGGQVTTWLTQLAEQYALGTNYEIHWVSLDHSRMVGRTYHREWGGQFFHRIPAGKVTIDVALYFWPSRILLMRMLKKIQPSLVHCWGTERSYPIVCATLKCPSMLSMQGVLTNLVKKNYLTDTWLWRTIAASEPFFIQSADIVTCESQWAIDRVKEIDPSANTRLIEYGVNESFYEVEWEPDLEQPYVLFIGAFVKWKGIDILLEALKLAGGKVRIKFVGDGPMREAVENCGVEGLEVCGIKKWDEVQSLMKSALCLVHPTLADSSPNVVKEARVIGLPIITSKHGGQAGYIHDKENGFIVDPLEPAALAQAMMTLMNDPQLAIRMGATNLEKDRSYLHPANTARHFLNLYEELLICAD